MAPRCREGGSGSPSSSRILYCLTIATVPCVVACGRVNNLGTLASTGTGATDAGAGADGRGTKQGTTGATESGGGTSSAAGTGGSQGTQGEDTSALGTSTGARTSGADTFVSDSSGDPQDGDGDASGTTSATPTDCGDGMISGAEVCDDRNTNDGDYCSATCLERTVSDGTQDLVVEGADFDQGMGEALRVLDFDGDGFLDLGVFDDEKFYVFRGMGHTLDVSAPFYTVDSGTDYFGNVWAGDLTGTRDDIVTHSSSRLRVVEGTSISKSIGFADPGVREVQLRCENLAPDQVALGDLDGTAPLDLAVLGRACHTDVSESLYVMLGPITDGATVEAASALTVRGFGRRDYEDRVTIFVENVIGDSAPEIIVGDPTYSDGPDLEVGRVWVLPADLRGEYSYAELDTLALARVVSTEEGLRMGSYVLVRELSGDGEPELIVRGSLEHRWFSLSAGANFWDGGELLAAPNQFVQSQATLDFYARNRFDWNRDGVEDFVSENGLWLADTDAFFATIKLDAYRAGAVADFNGDKFPDLVLGSRWAESSTGYENAGRVLVFFDIGDKLGL